MIYVTLLDQFHPGIYSSQVIDVCDYLNAKHNTKIRVVAFLSIRELVKTDAKNRLKKLSPMAIVLPAFPGLKNFQYTSLLLFFVCLVTGERIAICRNVFCTKMALRVRRWGMLKKIVFDGRSAMSAEISEYDVFPVDYLRNNVKSFESYVVNNADYRMAVSQQLVNYWQGNFGYKQNNHVVIPCTLDRKYFNQDTFTINSKVYKIREELGIKDDDTVFVYSGSTAPWQSFELLEKIFLPILVNNKKNKILFLSKENGDNKRLKNKFPEQVYIKWVEHQDVLIHLQCCDYGILVREQSDTNKVASPTKFAEYLYAGLKVLVSKNLGDFSSFVTEHNCGYIIDESNSLKNKFEKTDETVKKKCFDLANQYFKKESPVNAASYKTLIEQITIN
ncbi:MAG TPA: hypothetical protein VKG26_08145 [Bacteroidia bacterium]|nr:hypothetical protein [Bacteroidia bacterium]